MSSCGWKRCDSNEFHSKIQREGFASTSIFHKRQQAFLRGLAKKSPSTVVERKSAGWGGDDSKHIWMGLDFTKCLKTKIKKVSTEKEKKLAYRGSESSYKNNTLFLTKGRKGKWRVMNTNQKLGTAGS